MKVTIVPIMIGAFDNPLVIELKDYQKAWRT